MSGNAKILTGLMERQALEATFAELAQITDPKLSAQRAQEIAQRGDKVLPMLLAMLDTDDPQLRGGLGQVAANMAREQVVPALRTIAKSRAHSDQSRLSAVTILDRFLDEPVDESLLSNLQNPDTIALQSLQELTHEMQNNQFVIIEYLDQLAEQPPEVARMILDAVPRLLPDPHMVTLLRMFAQADEPMLARAALEQLSQIRSTDAAQALNSLTATLPPEQAALAERSLRKLRMRGIEAPAPVSADTGRRVLLSQVDGIGSQMIWFISRSDTSDQGTSLSILVQDPTGVIVCSGSTGVPSEQFPPAQTPGSPYILLQGGDLPAIILLEVPFDVGRQAVREALTLNWVTGNPTPLEYRLFNPWIWEVGPSSPESSPGDVAPGDYTPAQTATILDHPAFATWFWQSPELDAAARRLGRHPSRAARETQITALANAQFEPQVVASYQRRLGKMVTWLALASEPETAALAQAASDHLAASPPAESPLVRRLIDIGLKKALGRSV